MLRVLSFDVAPGGFMIPIGQKETPLRKITASTLYDKKINSSILFFILQRFGG
jgi:hypothetical protein